MKKIYILMCIIIIGIVFLIISLFSKIYFAYNYYNNDYYDYFTVDDITYAETFEYETKIDHTVKYDNQTINSKEDGINLIKAESSIQENKCNNDLKEEYEKIFKETGIYGINFCELQKEDVKEIYKTLKDVYENYPFIKDYVTNITLVNDGGTSSYIAAFKPSFTFATSNTNNRFPFVIKIQVFLNSSYYLNNDYLKLVIKNASSTDYFPKDTTKYSLIAHEFGHVITYVLAIKNYEGINTLLLQFNDFSKYSEVIKNYINSNFSKMIVDEAYNNYTNTYGVISKEDFRKNISQYANSYDENGDVIYNETIAEAFHDYYLHNKSANKSSIEIINVLNKYIEKYKE